MSLTKKQLLERAPGFILSMPPEQQDAWAERILAGMSSPEHLAKVQREKADQEEREAIKADSFVTNFIKMTPAEVEAYVANNTANLAQVRALLTKMALMLLALARREYR